MLAKLCIVWHRQKMITFLPKGNQGFQFFRIGYTYYVCNKNGKTVSHIYSLHSIIPIILLSTLLETIGREIRFHPENFSTKIMTCFNHAGIGNVLVYVVFCTQLHTHHVPVLYVIKVFSKMSWWVFSNITPTVNGLALLLVVCIHNNL